MAGADRALEQFRHAWQVAAHRRDPSAGDGKAPPSGTFDALSFVLVKGLEDIDQRRVGVMRAAVAYFEGVNVICRLRDRETYRAPFVRVHRIGEQEFQHLAQQTGFAIDRAVSLPPNY